MKERGILFRDRLVRRINVGAKTQTRRIIDSDRLFVRLPGTVTSDEPFGGKPSIVARPGRYRARLNPHGAVSILVGEQWLGVKPGEFDFICPYADGDTKLVRDGDRQVWTIEARQSRLWVREAWGLHAFGDETDWERGSVRACTESEIRAQYTLTYRADWGPMREGCYWRPGIFLPRWASRTTLDVALVRIERLQWITETDASAEGVEEPRITYRKAYPSKHAADIEVRSYRDAFAELWQSVNGAESWSSDPWVWSIAFRRLGALGRAP